MKICPVPATLEQHSLLIVEAVVKVDRRAAIVKLVVLARRARHVVSIGWTLEDAFFKLGTLGVVIFVTCVDPVLLFIVAELGHTDAIDSVRSVMIRDVPVSAVCVGVYTAVEVNRAPQVVPLSIIFRVLEAEHVVDLGSRCANFNSRLDRGVEVSIITTLLHMIREVHCVLICIVGLVCFNGSNCVLGRGASRDVINVARVWPVRCLDEPLSRGKKS